jgi:predicted nucleotidyltransferase
MSNMSAKHPSVEGISLRDLRRCILDSRNSIYSVRPIAFMEKLGLPIMDVDKIMRDAAKAGYFTWNDGRYEIAPRANRLCVDKLTDPISRDEVDVIISTVVKRVRKINARDDNFFKVSEVKLFGSTLDEEAQEFGDVDVSISIKSADLPNEKREALKNSAKDKIPKSWNNGMPGIWSANRWYEREILNEIKKGLKSLSLTKEDPEEIGTRWMSLYSFSPLNGKEGKISGRIVVPETAPVLDVEGHEHGLPEVTCRVAAYVDDALVDCEYGFEIRDIIADEECFLGNCEDQMSRNSELAGAQHLCPTWKEERGSIDMMRDIVDWARAQGSTIFDGIVGIEISSIGERTFEMKSEGVFSVRGRALSAGIPESYAHFESKKVSRIDAATIFAMSMALKRAAIEILPGSKKGYEFDLDLDFAIDSGKSKFPKSTVVAQFSEAEMRYPDTQQRYRNQTRVSVYMDEPETPVFNVQELCLPEPVSEEVSEIVGEWLIQKLENSDMVSDLQAYIEVVPGLLTLTIANKDNRNLFDVDVVVSEMETNEAVAEP